MIEKDFIEINISMLEDWLQRRLRMENVERLFRAEENSKISVKIIVQEGILNFVVYNKIVNKKGNEEHSLKVGLKNTFEHLAQVYAGGHTITINENLCKFFFKKLRRANIPIN